MRTPRCAGAVGAAGGRRHLRVHGAQQRGQLGDPGERGGGGRGPAAQPAQGLRAGAPHDRGGGPDRHPALQSTR